MNKLSIYVLLNILVSISFGNTALNGYVYDSNGIPISNVEVYIEKISIGSVTDASGYFQITFPKLSKEENDYFLIVSHIGYVSKKVEISTLTNIKIYLEKELLNANQIVVTALGYKSHIKDTPVITHIITGEEIYESPYNSATDIIEFIMPNVQRIHDPHGTDDKLKVQGLDNRFVVFMIDGNRISGEFAGNIDLSIINIDDIERIEVIRSGMSTLYGSDSMGGLINIITKKNKKPISINASYKYDLPVSQSISIGLGAQLKNFDYKLNVNYNGSPGYDLTNYSKKSKTVEENLNYKISNSLSFKWNDIFINYVNRYYKKEVNLYNYKEDWDENGIPMFEDGLLSAKENSRYTDYTNSLYISYGFNDVTSFKLKLSKELYDKGFYYPYYYDSYPNNIGETITSSTPIRYDCSGSFNTLVNNHHFLLGAEYAKETYHSYDVFSEDGSELLTPSIFSDNKKRIINEYSLFATDKFKIFNREIVLGLRSTKYSSYHWQFIPSVSVRYEDSNGKNIRFNYSKGYRVPSIKELYYNFPDHPVQPLYGNLELRPSTSDYYALSIEPVESSSSSLEFYVNNVSDMISPVSTSNNRMEYTNVDQIRLYGFNVNFDIPIHRKFTIKSVLSCTQGKSNDEKLLEGISKYSVNMRIKYNIFKNINLLFTTKYNSNKKVFVYGSDGSPGNFYELDSYSISDILLSIKYGKISIKGGVKNMFNYLAPSRDKEQASENLTTIDPGQRFYLTINFSI